MDILIGIIIFFFGTIIGSFLNVVILRTHTGRGLGGRSGCMACGHKLHWHDLVPLASFAVLGGRCAYCHTRISWQYPIVEFLTGCIFFTIAYKFMYILAGTPQLFVILTTLYVFIFCLYLVLAVFDIRHKRIVTEYVWVINTIAFATLFILKGDAVILHIPTLISLFAGPLVALPFFLLSVFSHERLMGYGDSIVMLGMGWLLGFSAGIVALLFSFWIGSIVSIALMVISKGKMNGKTAVPFGPFLVVATFIVFALQIDFTTLVMWFHF